MVLLYWTYVYVIYQEYGRNLSTLGVDAKEIPAYQSLWQCVAPLDRQNVINLWELALLASSLSPLLSFISSIYIYIL